MSDSYPGYPHNSDQQSEVTTQLDMNFPAVEIPARKTRAREKVCGDGPCLPLDREAKARIIKLGEALKHPTEKGNLPAR